eukprot:TRINITY_DN4180_c0_g2_i2.p1 TRINITY_DN4180_c0_g2~~TRINITY_DN4180_c0_g2_i2.p1  ORF type:complete len:1025 (-),score=313.23 TRINITY_DN4180_c0_g2_i2:2-3076(-)
MFMKYIMEKAVSKEVLALNMKQTLLDVGKDENGHDTPSPPTEFVQLPLNTYLDLFVITALRFIQATVPKSFHYEFIEANTTVQTSSAEFLQYLLQRVPDSRIAAELAVEIQDPILQNLAKAVSATGALVLQVHLLQLLRTLVSLEAVVYPDSYQEQNSIRNSPMLRQTLVVGLFQPTTRNVRFHWLDFITSILPYFKGKPTAIVVPPLVQCLCTILPSLPTASTSTSVKDQLIILKSLFILMQHALSVVEKTSVATKNTAQTVGSALMAPARLFTDFMKDVFYTEEAANQSSEINDGIFKEFPNTLRSLIKTWGPATAIRGGQVFSGEGEVHNKYAIQDHILQILDLMMSSYPSQVLDALLLLWEEDPSYQPLIQEILAALEVSNSPDTVIWGALVLLNQLHQIRMRPTNKKPNSKRDYSLIRRENTIMEILEVFVAKCVHMDCLGKVWAPLAEFLRVSQQTSNNAAGTLDRTMATNGGPLIGNSGNVSAVSSSGALKILDAYVRRQPFFCLPSSQLTGVSLSASTSSSNLKEQSTIFDDKRIKRDLQDLTQKLIENAILVVGRIQSTERTSSQSIMLYASTPVVSQEKDSKPTEDPSHLHVQHMAPSMTELGPSSSAEGEVAPSAPSAQSERRESGVWEDHSIGGQLNNPAEASRQTAKERTVAFNLATMQWMGQHLASLMDNVFEDKNDNRVTSILYGILHGILPHLRDRSLNSVPHSLAAISLLASLCAYPYTLKALRKDLLELFNDSDLFLIHPETFPKWKTTIDFLFAKDKTAFGDFLKHIAKTMSTQPAMLFSSKDADYLLKAKALKRLAFIVYCGSTDQYSSGLPQIQERLVEALKIPNAFIVYSHVFLVLRVLMVRVSPSSLRSFWPTILTELIRIFSDPMPDTGLVLSACKLLDLIFVLPFEESSMYQWMFLADCLSTDNVNFTPYVQRLISANGVREQPITAIDAMTAVKFQRPLITVRSVADLRDPADFKGFVQSCLAQWRIHFQWNSMAAAPPDYNYISQILENDFIEFVAL